MRICPKCSFTNEEGFPTCVWCNTALHDVPVLWAADPAHPEHEQQKVREARWRMTSAQIWWAGVFYTVLITGLAVFPGLVFSVEILLLYAASSVLIFGAFLRHASCRGVAALLQGAGSAVLVLLFGPMQPLIFFMLAMHVCVPLLIWHWVELIHDLTR